MKKGKVIIGIIILYLIFVGYLYYYYQKKEIEFPLREVGIYTLIGFLAVTAITFVIYYGIEYYKNRTNQGLDIPKEIVNSFRATEIWKEEFIKYNHIPYVVKVWDEGIMCHWN